MIRLFKFSEVAPADVFARVSPTARVDGVVAEIIADVRKRGDEALLYYTEKFDGAKLESLRVTEREIEEARAAVEPEFLASGDKAANPEFLPIDALRRCQREIVSLWILRRPEVITFR